MGARSVEAIISDPEVLEADMGECVGSCYAVLIGTDRAGGVVQALPDVKRCPDCLFRYSCSASLPKYPADSEQNDSQMTKKLV